jgi:hypothetical protein
MSKIDFDTIRVATPCRESWDDMAGTDHARHCAKCELNVFNISEMTQDDAEALIKQTNGRLCVRLYKRHDGTVINTDCPEGIRLKWFQRLRMAALFAVVLSGVLILGRIFTGKTTTATDVDMDTLRSKVWEPSLDFVSHKFNISTLCQCHRHVVMGKMIMPTPPTPPAPSPDDSTP